MFWIPCLSIMVFVIVVVISFFVGFKIGWRATLYFSIVFWVLFGAVIGVSYAIYQVAIWPFYKMVYFDNIIGSPEYLNTFALSSYYKTNLVLTFVGLMSPFVLLIAFLIYFFTRKKLNKYLALKTQIVSKSEKVIVERPNVLRSRLLGVSILGFSSLFYGSFLASSFNTIITPNKKANFFTKFNDTLGNIYSFGLANNSSTIEFTNNFLKNEKNLKVISDGTNAFVAFATDGFENKIPNLQAIQALFNTASFQHLLSESKKSTEAIFASTIYDEKINFLKLDKKTVQTSFINEDQEDVRIGFGNSQEKIFIEDLDSFFNQSSLNVDLPLNIKKFLVDKIQSFFVPFENTFPVKNHQNQLKEVQDAQKQLQERKNLLVKTKENIINYQNQIKTNSEKLNQLTGIANIDGFSYYGDLKTQFGSIVFDLEQKVKEIYDKWNDATNLARIAESNFLDRKSDLSNKEYDKQNLIEEIKSTKNEVATLENQLKNDPKNQTLKSTIQVKKNDIYSYENQLKTLESSLENLKQEIKNAKNDFENKQNNANEKQKEFVSIENGLQQKNFEAENAFMNIKSSQDALKKAQTDERDLESQRTSWWKDLDNNSIKWVELKLAHAQRIEKLSLKIKREKQIVFENTKKLFLDNFKKWLDRI